MSLKERIVDKAEAYVIMGIIGLIGPLVLAGLYSHLDARHEPAGSVAEAIERQERNLRKAELNQVRRKIRELKSYERLAPSTTYSAARQSEIDSLTDEEKELERALDEAE